MTSAISKNRSPRTCSRTYPYPCSAPISAANLYGLPDRYALVTVLVAEIVLTMADFIVEISVRKPISHDTRLGRAADGPRVDSGKYHADAPMVPHGYGAGGPPFRGA